MSVHEEPTTFGDRFERFLFIERELSVKATFDNIRNYLICASLFVIAILSTRRLALDSQDPFVLVFVWCGVGAIWVLSIACLLLNLGQSIIMLSFGAESLLQRFPQDELPVRKTLKCLVVIAGILLLASSFVGLLLVFAVHIGFGTTTAAPG